LSLSAIGDQTLGRPNNPPSALAAQPAGQPVALGGGRCSSRIPVSLESTRTIRPVPTCSRRHPVRSNGAADATRGHIVPAKEVA